MTAFRNALEWLDAAYVSLPDKDKPAFVWEGGAVSFRELRHAANQMAALVLDNLGPVAKKPVAVCLGRVPKAVAAFLGVARSGNFYVPLDPDMPDARLAAILKMVEPAMLMAEEDALARFAGLGFVPGPASGLCRALMPAKNPDGAAGRGGPAINALSAIDADPLCVTFTSGSTGTPKGVVATHRNVIDYITSLNEALGVGSETVYGMQAPFHLDACLKEIYGALSLGATAVIVPKSLFMFPVRLLEFLAENKVDSVCWVSSALELVAGLGALGAARLPALRLVAFGGERIRNARLNAWLEAFPGARFVHLYGPTEATGMSAFHVVEGPQGDGEQLPIGRPLANREILLMGDGEICIRGAGLSPGYFGDPAATAAAFVQNPLAGFPDRMYRTGDIGRAGADGLLYFLHRRDHQVKHMGHRIELSEIELAAGGLGGVETCCCAYDGEKGRILLFCAGRQSDIMPGLRGILPRHMLPARIFWLDALPTTDGGKIDRAGLLRRHGG